MKLWAGRFQKETDNLVNELNASITSPCSLYSEELVTFNESSYDQTNATGFINLWGLPDTVLALREQGKL